MALLEYIAGRGFPFRSLSISTILGFPGTFRWHRLTVRKDFQLSIFFWSTCSTNCSTNSPWFLNSRRDVVCKADLVIPRYSRFFPIVFSLWFPHLHKVLPVPHPIYSSSASRFTVHSILDFDELCRYVGVFYAVSWSKVPLSLFSSFLSFLSHYCESVTTAAVVVTRHLGHPGRALYVACLAGWSLLDTF